jgi:hypothetical protein
MTITPSPTIPFNVSIDLHDRKAACTIHIWFVGSAHPTFLTYTKHAY